MFDSVQTICLGAAAVFDTVLLLALLERRNWHFARLPIVLMMAGAWLWHGGQFALLLLEGLPGALPWYLQRACMVGMATGLLLMPCGLLHGTWRVWQRLLEVQSRSRLRHVLSYLPLLVLFPLAWQFFVPGRGNFSASVQTMELPYLLCVGGVNTLAAVIFLRVGRSLQFPHAGWFFFVQGLVLLAMTCWQWLVYFFLLPAWPDQGPSWRLTVTLSPLAPALVFAYFVIRFQFFQIVLERSLVYGAILGGMIFFHQLAFQDVSVALPEGHRFHVVFLEMIALATLILVYRPLRQRIAEGLNYMLGVRVAENRQRLRQMSHDLSVQAGRPSRELLGWFVQSLGEALQVEYVVGRVFHDRGETDFRWGRTQYCTEERLGWLYRSMRSAEVPVCSRRLGLDPEMAACMHETAAGLAVVKVRDKMAGLLVIGRGRHNRELSEEETNAVQLLVEQLAITVDNGQLQAERLVAERQAMQREKLSALGLLASSIAHEVKNPLSAIKTIASVIAEEMGPDSPLAEDVGLILGEVERLAETTNQLLDIARPRQGSRSPASLAEVIGSTLKLLRHLAQQQKIVIETRLADDLPPVQVDEHSLREIFFNLVSNSMQAAGPGGRVAIQCRRDNGFVVTEVSDSGPGMPEETRRHLFEPFLTTKETGTGLGLFLVGRRVGELGGTICCDRSSDQGTSFTLKLPYQPS